MCRRKIRRLTSPNLKRHVHLRCLIYAVNCWLNVKGAHDEYIFNVGAQCSRAARIEGPRTSGKGEGVSGRIAMGGVTKVDIHAE